MCGHHLSCVLIGHLLHLFLILSPGPNSLSASPRCDDCYNKPDDAFNDDNAPSGLENMMYTEEEPAQHQVQFTYIQFKFQCISHIWSQVAREPPPPPLHAAACPGSTTAHTPLLPPRCGPQAYPHGLEDARIQAERQARGSALGAASRQPAPLERAGTPVRRAGGGGSVGRCLPNKWGWGALWRGGTAGE